MAGWLDRELLTQAGKQAGKPASKHETGHVIWPSTTTTLDKPMVGLGLGGQV